MKALVLLLSAAGGLLAQSQTPHIGYAYPTGLQRGTAVQVVVGGKTLQNATAVEVSGPGLSAELVGYTRPMTNMERNAARERASVLQKKRQQDRLTAEEQQELSELRQKLANNPRQQPNPQIAETVVLRVTASADAALGDLELRVLTPQGLSNPLRFCIGAAREHDEQEPNDIEADSGALVPLPLVVNGQVMPGDVDRFRFRAQKGMHLVAAAECRSLIPYLADAVPGWFQATLTLFDAQGQQVAFDDDNRFLPDPLLVYDVPADGDYIVEIKDAIYRGREDFVYRLHLGELPVLTTAFPLGARVGDRTTLQLAGVNLPAPSATVQFTAAGPQPFLYADASAPCALLADTRPECGESEPNDADPQRLTLPQTVNGCIARPDDVDAFCFDARKGQQLVAEVQARRLGSPLDSLLRLHGPDGRELGRNDDFVDAGAGLVTHQADSRLQFTAPADGTYRLLLSDTQHKGAADRVYRLRLGPPQPDFALRVVPSAINVRAGATAVFTVHVLRQDGFTGDVALQLLDPLPGFELSGGLVPGALDKLQLTLTAPPQAPAVPVRLRLAGSARIAGRTVVRAAVPAEDMMQAFLWRHLVPADEWLCAVLRGGAAVPRLPPRGQQPLRLVPGATAELPLAGSGRRPLPAGVEFVLSDPPAGVALKGLKDGRNGPVLLLQTDARTAVAGARGNLIVDVYMTRTIAARDSKQKPRQQRNQLGTLPAIPFAIAR